MITKSAAETLIVEAIQTARADSGFWQLAFRWALDMFLKLLPRLLPIILLRAQVKGVELAPTAIEDARKAAKE